MKKSTLILIIFILTATAIWGQDSPVIMKSPNSVSNETNQTEKIKTYYFHEVGVDSTLFDKDSIVLYTNRIDHENPKLELYDNSKFRLFYNIKIQTVEKTNDETGERTMLTVQSNDELAGTYSIMQIESSPGNVQDAFIKFILKDSRIYYYDIIDKNDLLLLVKK